MKYCDEYKNMLKSKPIEKCLQIINFKVLFEQRLVIKSPSLISGREEDTFVAERRRIGHIQSVPLLRRLS